ncbi:MAG: hypothetical protein KJZ80_19435 [Hyphomicrobiaceae bacterium]|nr:hypothetical protein [Hyphomicrobiaceae bacterium]
MSSRLLLRAFALAVTIAASAGATAAYAQTALVKAASPFSELSGSWSGGGKVRFSDGKSERITCRAYYNPKGDGEELGLAIRCASISYKIDIRASLLNENGRLSGRWEERTFNAEGDVTGRASSGSIRMDIAGGGLSGSMSVSYGSSTQAVSISTEGSNLKGVVISLSRG